MAIKKCKKCGYFIPGNASVCPKCGCSVGNTQNVNSNAPRSTIHSGRSVGNTQNTINSNAPRSTMQSERSVGNTQNTTDTNAPRSTIQSGSPVGDTQYSTNMNQSPVYYDYGKRGNNKLYIIIALLIVAIIIGALLFFNKDKQGETVSLQESITNSSVNTGSRSMNLRGYVGKYPINMNLSIDGDKVSGTYYYNSSHSELKLSGTVNGNRIELNETTEEGRPTGHFDGVISDDAISGEFINYKGEHFNFNVSSDSGGYKENGSSRRTAVIDDPDGYTNVRSKPSVSSDVVTQIYDGEEFLYEPFNNKWVKVYDGDGNFLGYLAASRVTPI